MHDYIPKGKNIKTRHGCTCLNEYKILDPTKKGGWKTIKNKCIVEDDPQPWCIVKPKCGTYMAKGPYKGNYYDHCLPSNRNFLDSTTKNGPYYLKENLLGMAIFYIIFVISLPILFYKLGWHALLEVYMPNFDLIATAIAFNNGPYGLPIFSELYNQNSDQLAGYISRLMINYLSLLGLTYLIARRVKITNSLSKGWAIGFVMLLLTYLIPNEFIAYIQKELAHFLFKDIEHSRIDKAREHPLEDYKITFLYFIVIIVGLSVAGAFIGLEKLLLAKEKIWLLPLVKNILLIDDILK